MPVVWKPVADPPINVTEGHLPGGAAVNGGRDEIRVAVRWLGIDTQAYRCGLAGMVISPVVRRYSGRHRGAATDETTKSTSLDVEPAQPVHLGQTALQRVLGTIHVEATVA